RDACPIPARGGGRSRPPSTRRCRPTSCPRPCTSASAPAAKPTFATSCSRRCATSSAGIWKNPRGEGARVSNPQSDALVFFGATGDLAYKKIFPALQAMVKRGHLDAPVIGVAKSGWNLEQFRARAKDSLDKHGGVDRAAFDKLCDLLRYVDGDYQDPATFQAIRKALGPAQRPAHYLAIPPALFQTVVEQLAQPSATHDPPALHRQPAP